MALGITATGWAVLGTAAVGAYSSHKAASAQSDASQAGIAQSDRQFDISRQDQLDQLAQQRTDSQPYRDAGTQSLKQLMAGTAPGGEFSKPFSMADYTEDPGYQFRLQEGEAGIQRQAAANGSRYSGAVLKALSRFDSGQASQEYGAAYSRYNNDQTTKFNRLSGLAGTGQTTTQALSTAGQQVNSNIAQLGNANSTRVGGYAQDAAEATASGYVGVGNAVNSGIKNLYGGR